MKRIILLTLALAIFPAVSGAGDDCENAKAIYQQGVKAMGYEERRELFMRATELCPQYAEAFVNLADAHENLYEYDVAERHYEHALSLKPDFYPSVMGLAELYLKTGRFQESRDSFLKALEIKPNSENAKTGFDVAKHQLGRDRKLLKSVEIKSCFEQDDVFQVMCMCPGKKYSFMKTRVCIPNVEFYSGLSQPTVRGRKQLIEIGEALKSLDVSEKQLVLVGHADSIGDEKANRLLSERRALYVESYLKNKDIINKDSIVMKSLGAGWPIADNSSSDGRQRNRRVEFILQD